VPALATHEIGLYYEVHGDGPPLVLAHGAGGNHLVWWQQIPALRSDYQVITFDHRGFGLSRDVPGGPGRRAFALDLAALLDHLGVREFAMVAHSMGGRTATQFAWTFPGRLRALVLSGTLGGAVNEETRRIQARHARLVAGSSARKRALCAATRRDQPALSYLYRALNRLNPPRARTFLAPTPGMRDWRGSSAPLLRALGVPLLFLVGAHDLIVPPAAVRAAHRALPESRYVEIPRAGHSAYFEQPAAFNAAVRGFLAEHWPAHQSPPQRAVVLPGVEA
jgi:pimeloyl-ACP methyl ester carboxylesterase